MRLYEFQIDELSQRQRKEIAGTEKDQFFTRPDVASKFANWVKSTLSKLDPKPTTMIEPSAGNGDLARHFPGIEMYDLDPQLPEIKRADFLKSSHKYQPGKTVIMNPPFGVNSNLAVAFFNKAATFADHIAQIVPITFRRPSVQDRMSTEFRLVDQYNLPKNAFYLPSEGDGSEGAKGYDVPAVAQIWTRGEREAEVANEIPKEYSFTRTPPEADFAFRRKGRRAGQIIVDPQEVLQTNPNSFIYVRGPVELWQKVDWTKYGRDTMGAYSISRKDIADGLATVS